MNVIYTLLFAFAFGYLIKNRGLAISTYLGFEALLFSFQTLNLTLEWVGGDTEAFGGPFPGYSGANVAGYGLVNLVITGVGIGLVLLGAKVATKRSSDRDTVAVG